MRDMFGDAIAPCSMIVIIDGKETWVPFFYELYHDRPLRKIPELPPGLIDVTCVGSVVPQFASIDKKTDNDAANNHTGEVIMSDVNTLQTLRNQSLRRAVGELQAALEAIRVDDSGEWPECVKEIMECIEKIESVI
ncbi:hypothetical protein SI35_23800 [Salmonella enterica]|nr:hypothetical protein [Salmonella enterica]EGG4134963.1 hypothetical protein [Salmonella enterica]